MSAYPEHEKLAAVHDRSQAIGEFLDWLGNEREPRVALCVWTTFPRIAEEGPWPPPGKKLTPWEILAGPDVIQYASESWSPLLVGIEALLAEYHGIDRDVLEQEKRAMLAAYRRLQPARAGEGDAP